MSDSIPDKKSWFIVGGIALAFLLLSYKFPNLGVLVALVWGVVILFQFYNNGYKSYREQEVPVHWSVYAGRILFLTLPIGGATFLGVTLDSLY